MKKIKPTTVEIILMVLVITCALSIIAIVIFSRFKLFTAAWVSAIIFSISTPATALLSGFNTKA